MSVKFIYYCYYFAFFYYIYYKIFPFIKLLFILFEYNNVIYIQKIWIFYFYFSYFIFYCYYLCTNCFYYIFLLSLLVKNNNVVIQIQHFFNTLFISFINIKKCRQMPTLSYLYYNIILLLLLFSDMFPI